MRKLLLGLFLLISVISSAQYYNGTIVAQRLYPPVLDTNFTPGRVGEIVYRTTDGYLYSAISLTGQKWARISNNTGYGLSTTARVYSLDSALCSLLIRNIYLL